MLTDQSKTIQYKDNRQESTEAQKAISPKLLKLKKSIVEAA
jgi:hypothetical protein